MLPNALPVLRSSGFAVLFGVLAGSGHAQPTPGSDPDGRPSTLRVVPRDVNSSAEEWTESTTDPGSGQVSRRVHRYTTFAQGLNYVDESGQLRPSQDLIELTDDGGAVATKQPHNVRFRP